MGIATTIMRGEDAFLVAAQAKKLGNDTDHELYQLNTAACRIAVWDMASKSLVVFDTSALVALAKAEAMESDPRRPAAEISRNVVPIAPSAPGRSS